MDLSVPVEARNGDGLQLLISLLVCYPEIGKVNLLAQENGVMMDFIMLSPEDEEAFETKRRKLMDTVRFYQDLETMGDCEFRSYYSDGAYHIFRDFHSLSRQEINLMVTLVQELFGDKLLSDSNEEVDPERVKHRAELIDATINRLDSQEFKESMVGMRDEGRITIFDRLN